LKVLLGLGSNQGNSRAAVEGCLERLDTEGRVSGTSRLWITRAIGPKQPDYLNAVALIDWRSGPRSFLKLCRELEAEAGRDRSGEERWGPRVLDLDLLLAENIVCRGSTLELPHPRFHQRRFALEPSAEVASDWVHPFLGLTIGELAERARKREPDAILSVSNFEL
jgi:2-amino-4-hydroxy-6-hydroxymethyldihydropteridine diphosphokinase